MRRVRKRKDKESYYTKGFAYSLAGHFFILLLTLGFGFGFEELPPPPVYSVTLEGGKQLGGKLQVADDNAKKTPLAPPKNVSEEQKKSEEKTVPLKEEKKEIKKEEEKKNEIPIKKEEPKVQPKKEEVVTPKATPKPKPPSKEEINKEYEKGLQRYLGNSTAAGGVGFGAAKLGGNDFGGGVVKSPEWLRYYATIKSRTQGSWTWYDSRSVITSTVEFAIAPNGAISGEKIVQSSGNPEFDQSVLRAVRQANPLPPPPPSVYNDFKLVRIIFDPREAA